MTRIDFPNLVTRPQITAGLRALADYLDAHPNVPIPPYGWDLVVSTHTDSDPDGITEVDRIAAILGAQVRDDTGHGGHYTAARAFGPITYTAFHIPACQKASRHAHAGQGTDAGPHDSQQAA